MMLAGMCLSAQTEAQGAPAHAAQNEPVEAAKNDAVAAVKVDTFEVHAQKEREQYLTQKRVL
jgi:hypothetical protein